MSMTRANVEKDLKLARYGNGQSLSDGMKSLILQYIDEPSSELWDRIRMTVLAMKPVSIYEYDTEETILRKRKNAQIYLWMAVCSVDREFPQRRPPLEKTFDNNGNMTEKRFWSRIPTPEIIERAIEWSIH